MSIEEIYDHINSGRFNEVIAILAPLLRLRNGRKRVETLLNTPFFIARNFPVYLIEQVVETGIREKIDDALLKFMLTFNVDPNRHTLPVPVLSYALNERAWDIAEVLLSFPYEKFSIKGSVNARDMNGNMPLHIVYSQSLANISETKRSRLINLLLDKGADPFIKNNAGLSLADLAVLKKDRAVIYDLFTRYPRIKTIPQLVSYPSSFLEQLEKLRMIELTRRATDIANARRHIAVSPVQERQTRARKRRRIDNKIQQTIPTLPKGFKISTIKRPAANKQEGVIKGALSLNPALYKELLQIMDTKITDNSSP